jgi:hypothetical protein
MESKNLSRRTFVTGALAVSALALLGPATALAAGPLLLGTRTITPVTARSIVPVTFVAGAFTRIQLRVHGGSIHVKELKVRFSNGEWATLPVRSRIRDGGQTQEIPLPGQHRYISRIEVDYRSRGRATVEFWGIR